MTNSYRDNEINVALEQMGKFCQIRAIEEGATPRYDDIDELLTDWMFNATSGLPMYLKSAFANSAEADELAETAVARDLFREYLK